MDRRSPLGLLLLVTLTVTSCDRASEPDRSADTSTTSTSPPAAVTGTPVPSLARTLQSPPQALDAPVTGQLAWVIDQLNEGVHALTEADVRERFASGFLAAVPPAQTIAVLRQFAATYAPVSFEGFQQPPGATQAVAEIAARSGETFKVNITVEPDAPHRIAGLTFQPSQPPSAGSATISSWDELDRELHALAPHVSFLAAEVVGGECRPVHSLDADRRLAIGSTFKLYVLGELARQVETGDAAWEEAMAIREDRKSLPSGTTQNETEGTEHTLRYYAAQMISRSDNTATDHLLFRLGRENVEAYQAGMGHGDPALNTPFLSTREMFALKLAAPGEDATAYLAAPIADKRGLLDAARAKTLPTLASLAAFTTPRHIETLEWFASGEDLCRAMVKLETAAERPGLEAVREILAINPGVPLDRGTWPYVGFKGGSEPGVLNVTWLLRRADGRRFVLTVGLNDPARTIDQNALVRLIGPTAALLAATK